MATKNPPKQFHPRRRKAPRKRKRLTVELTDDNRRPFPGLPVAPNLAKYYITALGRVYRDDGFLVVVSPLLKVRLISSLKLNRSVPLAVVTAFGHAPPNYGDQWRPWVDPDGPIDPLTGQLRCSIADIRYATHSEIVAWARSGRDPSRKPKTTYPLL